MDRLIFRIASAKFFNTTQAGFVARAQLVCLNPDDFSHAEPFPDDFTFPLYEDSAHTVLQAGKNGIVSATVFAEEGSEPKYWRFEDVETV